MSEELITAVAKLQVHMEHVCNAVDEHKEVVQEAIAEGKSERAVIESRITAIEKKVSAWGVALSTLKLVGGTVLLVMTFKFGAIKGIWK